MTKTAKSCINTHENWLISRCVSTVFPPCTLIKVYDSFFAPWRLSVWCDDGSNKCKNRGICRKSNALITFVLTVLSMNHTHLFSVSGGIGFYGLINLNSCKKSNVFMTFDFLYTFGDLIDIKWDAQFPQYTVYKRDIKWDKHVFQNTAPRPDFARSAAVHVTQKLEYPSLFIEIEVIVFHCNLICSYILNHLLYWHEHHTLSYNLITVCAKIMNFEKTLCKFFSHALLVRYWEAIKDLTDLCAQVNFSRFNSHCETVCMINTHFFFSFLLRTKSYTNSHFRNNCVWMLCTIFYKKVLLSQKHLNSLNTRSIISVF